MLSGLVQYPEVTLIEQDILAAEVSHEEQGVPSLHETPIPVFQSWEEQSP